jgi:predicted O-linked N-acetylglucosamine transferase (SPINDLY family)
MKKFALIGLVLGLLAMGCAPNLVSYPPMAINQIVVEGLQNFKISSQMPSEEYGAAFKNVVENNKNTVVVYQEKLFPIFNQMHQKYQKKNYDGTNALIAKARGYNAKWLNSYKDLKSAFEKLSEVNKKTNNPTIKTKTDQLVDFGIGFVGRVLNAQNTTREFLDIVEGYDRARVEMNLSYLTKENEQRFNRLSQSLHESDEKLNKEAEVLFRLLVELNELLIKGGG